ncbi:MAG TPA: GTP cyclohydrolase II [Micropepsaceae bacterium]
MTADKPGEIKPVISQALIPPEQRVERAAGDLRRGAPVLIRADAAGESGIAVAAETVKSETLVALGGVSGPSALILTHARATTLKIRLYTADIVSIALPSRLNAADIRAIADPATDLDHPLKGPFEASRGQPPQSAGAAVRLAKLAGLLPAAVLFPIPDNARTPLQIAGALSEVSVADIHGFERRAAETLQLVVRASVPLAGAEQAELAAFRPENGGPEHYAVIIGAKGAPALSSPGPVLTRLHSECFTGDFLASLKCDCGDQLRGAIQRIAKEGGGILLYLAQEGRGIGLMNKLRAYRLQDEGFDTIEANQRLGFEADERLYDIAACMLRLLGYSKVRLLTNNPGKVAALEAAGIEVTMRVPHAFPENAHNRDYLRVKAEKSGHIF